MLALLTALQALQALILWLHDWLPLGPFNDVRAVRAEDSLVRLLIVTLIQSVPYTIGLAFSLMDMSSGYPLWLWWWLWISYGLLFVGELRAWWFPYLVRAEPRRAERYRVLFGATHAFLPERNGVRPNTLHVVLHAATAATLVTLALAMR
jgi:hypothetical protein